MADDQTMEKETSTSETLQPVDRARRARFVAGVVGFCLLTAAAFTGIAGWGLMAQLYMPIVELYISSALSLAMATTLAYITGSVVDYNGGVGNMFRRSSNPNDYVFPDAKG